MTAATTSVQAILVATLTATLVAFPANAQEPSQAPTEPLEAEIGPRYQLPAPAGTSLAVSTDSDGAENHTGARRHALDLLAADAAEPGFTVLAVRGGRVLSVRADVPDGNCRRRADRERPPACWAEVNHVLLDHHDGTSALYLHLAHDSPTVRVGEIVAAGTPLGTAGASGWTRDVRLHVQLQDTPPPHERTDKGWFLTRSHPLAFVDASVRERHPDGRPADGDIVVSDNPGSELAPFVPLARPDELPVRLPWPAGTARSIVAAYDPDAPEGYGLQIDSTAPFDVHPLFGGELVFAGCAQGRSGPLGATVIVRRGLGARTIDAVHRNLDTIAPTLLEPAERPLEVGPNDVIGRIVGDEAGETEPTCALSDEAAPLYAGIVSDATIDPDGTISGGTPVDPEPLVGQAAYEGLTWWPGPMTARDLDPAPDGDRRRIRWANRMVADGVAIGFGQTLQLVTRVRDDAPLREVRFRVHHPEWARPRPAARLHGFDPAATWRLVAVCRPPGVGGEPRRTPGCRWEGDRHDALVAFDWDPTATQGPLIVPWLPRARAAIDAAANDCVPVALGIEAVDAAGRVLRTPMTRAPRTCRAGTRAGEVRTVRLQPLTPPRPPAGVDVRRLRVTGGGDAGGPDGGVSFTEFSFELRWRDRSDNEDGFRVYRVPVEPRCVPRSGPGGDKGFKRLGPRILMGTLPPDTTRFRGKLESRITWRVVNGRERRDETELTFRLEIAAFNRAGESRAVATSIDDVINAPDFTCGAGIGDG